MAPQPFTLVPVNTRNLMSIDPQKNWRRYPSVPITKAMTDPAYIPIIGHMVAAPSVGAAADNDGETGTLSVTFQMDPAYADTSASYAPKTQKAKASAANLTPGTIIAPDIGKSYAADNRGDIEPMQPYPETTVPTTVTPPQFLPAGFVPATGPAP